jgi:predicted dehydrogenase
MTPNPLKIALVGCGQIADAHLQEIRKLPEARVVAVCDREADLAGQAAARFEVPGVFTDLGRMLETARPDVLHVTTPPQTHRALARQALAAGVHVYVEKPFALDAAEAQDILDAAGAAGRLVCVGHDQLFEPDWQACQDLVRGGELGEIVHVDAVMGYDLSGPFGKLLAADPGHWVHRLPGGLFQNTISHALYKITDFLPDEEPQVWATWFCGAGGAGYPTDLRVLLRGERVTGTLLFLSGARPVQRAARLYGTKGGVEVDLDGGLLRRYHPGRLPGPFARIQAPFRHLGEAARSLRRNVGRFFRSELQYFAGLNRLIAAFYRAIREDGEPPIPYREIHRVTALMDEIFRKCREAEERPDVAGDRELLQVGAA